MVIYTNNLDIFEVNLDEQKITKNKGASFFEMEGV
jgi:hypothetical protein